MTVSIQCLSMNCATKEVFTIAEQMVTICTIEGTKITTMEQLYCKYLVKDNYNGIWGLLNKHCAVVKRASLEELEIYTRVVAVVEEAWNCKGSRGTYSRKNKYGCYCGACLIN